MEDKKETYVKRLEEEMLSDQEIAQTLKELRMAAEDIPQELQWVEDIEESLPHSLLDAMISDSDGKPDMRLLEEYLDAKENPGSAQIDEIVRSDGDTEEIREVQKEPVKESKKENAKSAEKPATKKKVKRRLSNGIRGKLLYINLVPTAILLLILTIVVATVMTYRIKSETKRELKNAAVIVDALFDEVYPGEFQCVTMQNKAGDVYRIICKGDHVFNEKDDLGILDQIKARTGMDLSLIFDNQRLLTTITKDDGSRYSNSVVTASIYEKVIEKGNEAFFDNVKISSDTYYAFYTPIVNVDGSRIGMIGITKPVSSISARQMQVLIPVILISIVTLVILCLINLKFTKKITTVIDKMVAFLRKVSKGNLSAKLDEQILCGEDEFAVMGQSITSMQHSIRELVEKDALTTLYNRRYGEKQLQQLRGKIEKNGGFYTVAIGDIDFFKKVNDTYGHECGDFVLKRAASILKKHVTGKGMVARWGGEEFMMIFEDLTVEQSMKLLEELLNDIRATVVVYGDQKVTFKMSFGVTEGRMTMEASDNLKRADGYLYYAKEHGRNQIVCLDGNPEYDN